MSGDGRRTNPWDLPTSLTTPEVVSGSRIHAFPGNYVLSGVLTFSKAGVSYLPDSARPTLQAYSGDININVDDVTLTNFDIQGTNPNRTSAQSGSAPTDITLSFLNISGKRIKLQGCRIFDIAELFVAATAEGFELTDCDVFNLGWKAPDRGHGHCFYGRNAGSLPMKITNCFFGYPVDLGSNGIHFYGDVTTLRHLQINQLAQTTPGFVIGDSETSPLDDIALTNSVLWNNMQADFGFNSLSGGSLTLTDNYLANSSFNIRPIWSSVTNTGNVSASGGANAVKVWPCSTPGMVARVVVVNWQQLDTVTVAVPQMVAGHSYVVENSFDPLHDFATVVYDGVGLSLNFINRTMAVPLGFDTPYAPLDKRFGVWVIRNV